MIHWFLWLKSLIIMLILDGSWIFFIMGSFFKSQVGHLMRATPSILGVLGAYMCMHTLVYRFLLIPHHTTGASQIPVFFEGLLFGACLFGVYEFTNYATLSQWPLKLLCVDILWGALLCGLVAHLSLKL